MVYTNGPTLDSLNKNISIFMQTLEIPGKKATIIGGKSAAGEIALLLKIRGVAFNSVKFHLVRLQIRKPNQVRDVLATQDCSTIILL